MALNQADGFFQGQSQDSVVLGRKGGDCMSPPFAVRLVTAAVQLNCLE